jgi:uncharacterized protein (DUF934 family)
MPRLLLRDRQLVEDDWRYTEELGAAAGNVQAGAVRAGAEHTDAVHPGTASAVSAVILGFDRWLAERDVWVARLGHVQGTGAHRAGLPVVRLGVVLLPEHNVEHVAPDLAYFSLVACRFSGPAEGRGYTQGRLLRERYDFRGELRATGYVRIDQLFFLARCGFNSFELAEGDIAAAGTAFSTFTAAYQPANDRGLAAKLA